MAKRNALKDVDPSAITICKQGANRQRIFLRKSVAEAELLTLPHESSQLYKQADSEGGWSTFYCVVAEPGAEEDPGMTGEQGSIDVWLDPGEIRKAAHRLLKNKAYVNLVHDGLAEEGLTIVENAVALADLDIEAPDGDVYTIKKDSWYVAIECNEDAIAAVESGDISGVSLEGSGIRVPIEKSAGTPAELLKALSFGESIGERELQDSLWRAWSTLETVIYDIFRDEDVGDPKPLVRTALAEFEAYLLGKLGAIPDDASEGLAKMFGTLDGTTHEEDNDMGLKEDFEAFKKEQGEATADLKKSSDAATAAVEGLVGLTGQLVERLEAIGKPKEEETPVKKSDGEPDLKEVVQKIGELADKMDEFDGDLTGIAKSVEALGEGDSDQDPAPDRIAKTNSKNPLAGLLS